MVTKQFSKSVTSIPPKSSPASQKGLPITDSPDSTPKITQNTSGSDLCIPITKLRDAVLGLAGDIEKMSTRLTKLENPGSKNPSESPFQTKETQTESDSSLHPPACFEATQVWEQYQTSKKSETQLLVEALNSLDLKSILEQQNRQMVHQNNTLNSLNRSFAQFSKSTEKPKGDPKRTEGTSQNEKVRNGSRAKRSKGAE